MFLRRVRPEARTLGYLSLLRRPFHSKRAKFVTLDAEGYPSEREIDIHVGDKHEAYVLVPPDVGNAIKVACLQKGSTPMDSKSLLWYYEGRYFTYSHLKFL